ncbi:MAG: ABC transporter substrate-binding protein [Colwellia sp.]|nr:ABC transporter substrate-binding protein [Colwellia sp.]
MKKLIGVLILSVFFFLGCSESERPQQSREEKRETIVAFLPLTGDLAFLGVPGKRAIEMAIEDLQKSTGNTQKLDVKFVDTMASPKIAVTRYAEAKTRYNTNFFITTLTGVSQALKPLIEKDGGLQLIVAIHPEIMNNSTNAIRFCLNAAQEASQIANVVDKDTESTVGLLISKDATSTAEVDNYIIPKLESGGVSYLLKDFQVGQKDFRNELYSFKEANVNQIVMLGYGSDFPQILKQLAEIDPEGKISIIGGIGFAEFPDWEHASYINRKVRFIAPSISIEGLISKQSNIVAARYSEKFDEKYMPYDGAFTYDAVTVLANAIARTNGEVMDVRNEILGLKTHNGVAGDISFLTNGDVEISMSWAVYASNKIKLLGNINER